MKNVLVDKTVVHILSYTFSLTLRQNTYYYVIDVWAVLELQYLYVCTSLLNHPSFIKYGWKKYEKIRVR